MSSYVYKKAIRYKLRKSEVEYIDKNDIDYYNKDFLKDFNLPDSFEMDSAYEDEHEIYLDKVYEKQFDEITGDFAKSRMLTQTEVECHLHDFKKFSEFIEPSDLRAIEICYYNGVDAPACYDVTEDSTDWIF